MLVRSCRSFMPGLALVLWSLLPVRADQNGPTSHFTFTANTGNNMMVLAKSTVIPTVDGVPIASGDEIGVFTQGGLCVGGMTWDGGSHAITVWGDNTETDGVDGMLAGEKLNYRIWKSGTGAEAIAFATYNTADPFSRSDSTYSLNGVSVLATLAGISAPAAPVPAAPADQSGSLPIALSLSWSTLATASVYTVQVSTDAAFLSTVFGQGNLAAGQAALTGLLNARTYYWHINATNAGGTGAWSATWTFSTVNYYTYTSQTGSNMTVLLKAAAVPTIDGSAVANGDEIGAFNSSGLCVGGTVWNGTTQTLTVWGDNQQTENIDGMADGEVLHWRIFDAPSGREVLAFAGYNTTDPFSRSDSQYIANGVSIFASLAGISAPGTPVAASPANGFAAESITPSISWNAGSGEPASSYTLQVSTAAGFGTTVYSRSGIAATSQTVSPALANGTGYYWRVKATGPGGTSAWAVVRSFITVIAAPALIAPAPGATGQTLSLTLSWGTVPDAGSYGMQLSTVSDFNTTVRSAGGLAGTSVAVSGLGGATYYWRVNATNANSTSAWSAPGTFTTISTLVIQLNTGWSMKSFNVAPLDSGAESVFGSPANFLLVKDIQGNAYCPIIGIEDLDTVHTGQGYKIFSSSPYTLTLNGTPIDAAATPIALRRGWNMIAYLPVQDMDIELAFAGIASQLIIAKDNAGNAFMPSIEINDVGDMTVGEGYLVYMNNAVVLTYPSGSLKSAAASRPMLRLPGTRHFARHKNTGSNATIAASSVLMDGVPVHDSCEIGAFDAAGNLVGAGTVLHGRTAFAVWGADAVAKENAGMTKESVVQLVLWDGALEYPVHFTDGIERRYEENAVLVGSLCATGGLRIAQFNLSKIYPNPFRSTARIAFEIPASPGASNQHVEIAVYDLKGNLVQTLAKGNYVPGRYSIEWNGAGDRNGATLGSTLYIVRMKAAGFEKKIKLIKVK